MWTGIDIGSHSLKVIQLSRSWFGRFRIESASHYTFSSASTPEQMTETLRQVLYSTGAKPPHCVVGVASPEVNLRITLVPPLKDQVKFKKMIAYELEQIAGKTEGDVYTDYCMINLMEKPYPERPILIGLAKNSYIDSRIDMLKQAGVIPQDVCPDTIALFAVLRQCRQIDLGETVLLMDIGSENINLIIQQAGNLILARNITGGGKLFTEAIMNTMDINFNQAELLKIREGNLSGSQESEPNSVRSALLSAMGHFQSVIQSSLLFCRAQLKKEDIEISRILVSGGGAKIKGFTEHLTSVLKYPVEAFNPFETIDVSSIDLPAQQTGEASSQKTLAPPSSMTVALGLARVGADESTRSLISFLPPAFKKKQVFYRQTLVYAVAVGLLLTALVILTLITLRIQKQSEVELAYLKEEWQAINHIQGKFDMQMKLKNEILAEYNVYTEEQSRKVLFTDALLNVKQLFPRQGAWLSEMTLGRSVSRRGVFQREYKDRIIVLEGYLEDDAPATLSRLKNFVAELNETNDKISASLERLEPVPGVSSKGKRFFVILIERQD